MGAGSWSSGGPPESWSSKVGDAAVYRRLVVACVRSELQYRTSFAARVLAESVITFLDCVVILALFTRVPALGGWDRGQVLVLYDMLDIYPGRKARFVKNFVSDSAYSWNRTLPGA